MKHKLWFQLILGVPACMALFEMLPVWTYILPGTSVLFRGVVCILSVIVYTGICIFSYFTEKMV